MARAADDLGARRAVLLLRCQKVREERQRAVLLRAEHACLGAEADLTQAEEDVVAQAVEGERRRSAAHEALRGRVVDPLALSNLTDLERDLDAQTADRAARRRRARMHLAEARRVAADSRTALQKQARASAQRARLAETLTRRRAAALDAAEEMEQDEQSADTWRAA